MNLSLNNLFIETGLSQADAEYLCGLFVRHHYKKGKYLLQPGEVAIK
jgi:hypothetical protein